MRNLTNLKIWWAISVFLLVVAFCASSVCMAGTYSGGDGSEGNPYIISDANDMQEIGANPDDWDDHFLMIADVNMFTYTRTQFNIIGNNISTFQGVFDGNGYAINNFTWSLDLSYGKYIGIFGWVDSAGEIKNLALNSVYINALPSSDFVGGLVGYNNGGLVSNCSVSGMILGSGNIGGLIGYDDGGTIRNCYSAIDVSGDRYGVGGLVGIKGGGEIAFCGTSGSVTGDDDFVGGLVGSASNTHIYNCFASGGVVSTASRYSTGGLVGDSSNCAVEDCYSTGDVTGNELVGGLFGSYSSSTKQIVNCYAAGQVTGIADSGGLIGERDSSPVINSFWDINTSGQSTSDGGTGKTTAEMKQKSTFTNWDFTETWGIEDNQTYPFLRLTYPVGDINLSKDVNLADLCIMAYYWLEGTGP